ncbi:hypothetical protein EON63_08270 [archaeon]|nr:MAG: hypothetical protein EON63_08270 [archaeon]
MYSYTYVHIHTHYTHTQTRIHTQDKATNRIAMGRFYHEVLANIHIHKHKPIHIYSAHDITLAVFLAALEVFDGMCMNVYQCVRVHVHNMCVYVCK